MKIFSIVRDWFTGWMKYATGSGVAQLTDTLKEVEKLAAQALPVVEWVAGVWSAVQNSNLPVADVVATELRKMCPDLPDIDKVAGQLSVKDRPDMLMALAVLVLRYTGASSVKLSVLRAAIEIAHLIYSASKGK